MRTVSITVYSFDELTPAARERARRIVYEMHQDDIPLLAWIEDFIKANKIEFSAQGYPY